MPEELLLYQDTPESKLWTSLANSPDIVVTQLKVTTRGSVGRVRPASYVPDLSLQEFTREAGTEIPLDGVFPVMAVYSLGRTMLLGDRSIVRYGKVQSLHPGLSVWELPKADNPVPKLIGSARVSETVDIPNYKEGDSRRLLSHIVLRATTDYLYATGHIENASQYPVYIAAANDPGAGDIIGGMKMYGPRE